MVINCVAATGLLDRDERVRDDALLPMSDRDRDTEILALRHQIVALERQLNQERVRFTPSDRAFLVL